VTDELLEVSDADHLVANPLVSIVMVAFNHAGYIAEAIDGIVSQQCDFPFELLIGEDFSTDKTREIVLDYQKKYPSIIRIIQSAKNVGADANFRRTVLKLRGEYVAFCDGDDYWCSSSKLARQIALIRDNPTIGVVHTDWVKSRYQGGEWKVAWNRSVHRRVRIDLLQGNLFHLFYFPKILRSCTLLLRRGDLLGYMNSQLGKKKYKFGDTVLAAYVTSQRKVSYLNEITAVYRVSPNSALRSGVQAKLDFLKSCLQFDTDARRIFSKRDDYPPGFRWEASVGLFFWAIRSARTDVVKFAVSDISKHFSVLDFIRSGAWSLKIRLPRLW
jgi:glycosyltransferase involved in cell wall biosynthesis